MLAGGVALDSIRHHTAVAQVQAALDSAALAGAAAEPGTSDAQRKKLAKEAFEANMKGAFATTITGKVTTAVEEDELEVGYAGTLPTTLMGIVGINTTSINVSARAMINSHPLVEAVFVLDYSSSMSWATRQPVMRDAAINMIEQLTQGDPGDNVRFGLVPFSSMVHVDLPASMVVTDGTSADASSIEGGSVYAFVWDAFVNMVDQLTQGEPGDNVRFGLVPFFSMVSGDLMVSMVATDDSSTGDTSTGDTSTGDTSTGDTSTGDTSTGDTSTGDTSTGDTSTGDSSTEATWSGCTLGRKYPFNTNVEDPDSGNDDSKWVPVEEVPGWEDECEDMKSAGLKVRPLTSDHQATIDQLEAMVPAGSTDMTQGLAFGWHLLDPGQPFSARAYDHAGNHKIIVLLSDGEQYQYSYGPDGTRTWPDALTNFNTLCAGIKESGITLITIAFGINESWIRRRVENCASNSEYYFDAQDAGSLEDAFKEITNIIAKTVYLSN
jgi:Mg-chelatase subunit ChlD